MEPLDPNALNEALAKQVAACDGPLLDKIKELKVCLCFTPPHCFPLCIPLHVPLVEALKTCAGEFYIKCPAFDDLARVCDFEPAFDAAKFKQKVLLDRVAQLEARVQELELKRKG